MKITIQAENLPMLKEAVGSHCYKVRFGPEFCDVKLPSLETLEEAYTLASEGGKEFAYVTPRVSNTGLEKIRAHLNFLSKKGKFDVIVNDFGVLNLLQQVPNLSPHLGRHLVYIPARCPWKEITEREVSFLTRRRVAKIFYQTGLNYEPTIRFFQNHGVQGVDIDAIPECFPYFSFLMKNGLAVSVHLHLTPVTVTRRCHTARFLGEKSPENCSKPCRTRAFLLKHDVLGVELFLCGNGVFKLKQPVKKEVKELRNLKVDEVVISMNPVTKIGSQREIDSIIQRLRL